MTDGLVQVGDAIEGLNSLEPGSVSLVLSDLPSGETRASFDVKADLLRLWPAVWRVVKYDGVVIFMASSFSFAAEIRAAEMRTFRYDLVWRKTIAVGHLNARSRPLRVHEFALVFWRSGGHPYYQPQMMETGRPIHAATRLKNSSSGQNFGFRVGGNNFTSQVSSPAEAR